MGDSSKRKKKVEKVRDTLVRGPIKAGVRYALWARTAGRCTLCNRRVLGDGRTFVHSVGAAEMAHIKGATATPGSPRGLDDRPTADPVAADAADAADDHRAAERQGVRLSGARHRA